MKGSQAKIDSDMKARTSQTIIAIKNSAHSYSSTLAERLSKPKSECEHS